MPKGYTRRKTFRRFKPSRRFYLHFLQCYNFALHNARLKLTDDKFRSADLLTVFIIGESKDKRCTVKEFGAVHGSCVSIAQNILKRASIRGLAIKDGGKRGRGYPATYYLTDAGSRIHNVMMTQIGNLLSDMRDMYLRQLIDYSYRSQP